MPAPSVKLTIADGALGAVPPSLANVFAVFGPSASGTPNVPVTFGGQPGDVVTAFGYGPGPSVVAALVASGATVHYTKVPTGTPGSASAVTPGSGNTGLSVLTLSGTPSDRYSGVVTVTKSGVAGATDGPAVSVSFDGGVSTGPGIKVPTSRSIASYQAVTGLTLTFSASTLVEGDTFLFTTVAPSSAASDVADAVDVVRQSRLGFALGYVVGPYSANDVGTVSGAFGLLFDTHRYVRFFVESVDQSDAQTTLQWIAALQADFANFEDPRCSVPAGYAAVLDPVTKFSLRRSIGYLAAVRAATTSVGTDAIKVADGPLVPFSGAAGVQTVYYDDAAYGAVLGDARFYTVQAWQGLPSYYASQPRLMSSPLSDFKFLTLGRVMDEGSRVADQYFTSIVGTGFRVSRRTGFILPADRLNIEQAGTQREQVALVTPGQVSDAWVTVAGNENVLQTETLTATVSLVPLFYPRQIDVTMTFNNPALTAV